MLRHAIVVSLGLLAAAGCDRHLVPEIGLGELPRAEQRELYVRLCASCHGAGGRGDGPCADELRVRPADLTRLAARHGGTFPREDVEDTLSGKRVVRAHGTSEMPVWGERLAVPEESPAAVAAGVEQARLLTGLIDYVASLQR